jgi:hypothetical protein
MPTTTRTIHDSSSRNLAPRFRSVVAYSVFDWNQDNHNSVVLARSGAGKSYLVKLEVLRDLYDGVHVTVIDPEDEYVRLAHAVGGTVVQLGAPGVRLDSLDLPSHDRTPGALTILAEVGLDMTRFPTACHLASWAKLTPRTIQSGPRSRGGKTGKGNPYLKGALGQAAAAAARTQTFLGEKYRRIVKRRGKLKALVAVARSILVIVWHLLSDPTMRFADLGPDYNTDRTDKNRKIRNHVRQLEVCGFTVTLTPVAA